MVFLFNISQKVLVDSPVPQVTTHMLSSAVLWTIHIYYLCVSFVELQAPSVHQALMSDITLVSAGWWWSLAQSLQ